MRRIFVGCVWVILGFLSGCATQEYQPYYSGEVKVVPTDQSDSYWKMDLKSFVQSLAAQKVGGCAKVQLTIDSNGRIVNPSIIKEIADPNFDSGLLNFLSNLRYKPSDTNPDHTPIQTTRKFAFDVQTTQTTARHVSERDSVQLKSISTPKPAIAEKTVNEQQACMAALD